VKNKNVLKVFGIMLLTTFVLTWIIPSSTVSTTGIEKGMIAPTGYGDIFSAIDIILYYFAKPAVFILFVGMFYGVINKTGAYKVLVDKIKSMFENKRVWFAILSIVFYSVTTALTGMYIPIFMFIPLSVAILLKLKYTKMQTILITVASSTVGLIGERSNAIIKAMTASTENTYLWVKIAILVVLIALNIAYIIKTSKNNRQSEVEEKDSIMFIPEERNAKKEANSKGISLLIVIALLFIVFVLGLTPWKDVKVFGTLYQNIQQVKIGSFAIFDSILGFWEVFGEWTYNSLYPTIVLAIIVMAIFNKLSFGEMIEGCIEGAKKVIGISFLAALMSLVVIFTLNSGMMVTIVNFIAKSGNIALVTLSSFLTTPFMVEVSYAGQYIFELLSTVVNDEQMIEVIGLIVQITYGFGMLIAPSSILLMIGLYYVEEKYTTWFKYVWKLLLAILILCLLAITIAILI